MAKSTGIVISAVAIGMGNEFVQTGNVNFRVGIAGLGAALFVTGVEKLNETAGMGLAILMFITVMLTPFGAKSPAEEVLTLVGQKSTTPPKTSIPIPKATSPRTTPKNPVIPFLPTA